MPEGIGEALRKERLAQGIELAEVEERTKIRLRYLRALEAEDFEALPGDAYVRGFLRTYGDFLGLDGLVLVEEYRRLVPPAEADQRPEPVLESARRLPAAGGLSLSGRAIAALAAAGVVGVLVVIGLVGGGSSDEGNKHGPGPNRQQAAGNGQTTTTTTEAPSEVTVRLAPIGEVWVCLVDQSGKPLVNGETLTAGDDRGPFRAKDMKLRLGNGELRLNVNGKDVPVPASASPIGFDLSPSGPAQIPDAQQPTCS